MTSPRILIAPSLLSADFAVLGEEVQRAARGGADYIHFDVMDGHFVPNLTIGPVVVRAVRDRTKVPFDVHLMIDEPLLYVEPFLKAGADIITFHAEVTDRPELVARKIRAGGAKVGVALNPDRPLSLIAPCLSYVDLVLVMTVFPGFGGQAFHAEAVPKIVELRKLVGDKIDIEVDGGIDPDTVGVTAAAGANVFVAGTATFGAPDIAAAIRGLREAAEAARTAAHK